VVVLVLLVGCGDDAPPSEEGADPRPGIEASLLNALDREVEANPDFPGEVVVVEAPAAELSFAAARGFAADAPFRVASVTKTFTAATVLRLVEEGDLDLGDPIADHLPEPFAAALESDGYDVEAITVRHLLQHLGGLYDYATDETYATLALTDPDHRWSPLEQVRYAVDHGEPRAAPGEEFHYSDTGYVLAGQIIESVTGRPLAEAYREILDFEGLGLDHTWLESLERPPDGVGPRAANHFGALDLSHLDPSFDLFGGGGLVSTAHDVARFYAALFGGEVFDDPATLATMQAETPESGRRRAGMGLFRVEAAGHDCWEHGGFWGAVALHCPGPDVTIVRYYGQALPGEDFELADFNILAVSLLDDV
jgi:D-alanyl-D-alanine carboxypeptidase